MKAYSINKELTMNTAEQIKDFKRNFTLNNILGRFIEFRQTLSDFGEPIIEAIFENREIILSDIEYLHESNKDAFVRQIDGTEYFTVYQRLYFGVGFHRMELILVTKDEKMFGVVLFDYFYDDDDTNP